MPSYEQGQPSGRWSVPPRRPSQWQKPHVVEDVLKSAEVQVERKLFSFQIRENNRGRLLRITEEGNGKRNSIIILLPSGESLKPVWQSKKDEKQPIGAFEGYSWDYDNPSETPSNCHIASLNIFRLKPSGMIFWRIKEGEIQNKQPVERFDIAFRYAPERVK